MTIKKKKSSCCVNKYFCQLVHVSSQTYNNNWQQNFHLPYSRWAFLCPSAFFSSERQIGVICPWHFRLIFQTTVCLFVASAVSQSLLVWRVFWLFFWSSIVTECVCSQTAITFKNVCLQTCSKFVLTTWKTLVNTLLSVISPHFHCCSAIHYFHSHSSFCYISFL